MLITLLSLLSFVNQLLFGAVVLFFGLSYLTDRATWSYKPLLYLGKGLTLFGIFVLVISLANLIYG